MSGNALREILNINKDLKNLFKSNKQNRPDQLARSIVIMATQMIIIIMFLSDDVLSVFTDNLLKGKEDYKINLKLLLYQVITLN